MQNAPQGTVANVRHMFEELDHIYDPVSPVGSESGGLQTRDMMMTTIRSLGQCFLPL
jgi:hypothetical protein